MKSFNNVDGTFVLDRLQLDALRLNERAWQEPAADTGLLPVWQFAQIPELKVAASARRDEIRARMRNDPKSCTSLEKFIASAANTVVVELDKEIDQGIPQGMSSQAVHEELLDRKYGFKLAGVAQTGLQPPARYEEIASETSQVLERLRNIIISSEVVPPSTPPSA